MLLLLLLFICTYLHLHLFTLNVTYSASLAAVPSYLCTAVKWILAVGEVMVHFDPSANIDGEVAPQATRLFTSSRRSPSLI
jgi:hypothetical protein